MSKTIALALILVLAASSLLMVGSSSEQSIPKPSIPEFTVQLVDNSYDVPATQTIDPYTGQKITHPSHHVENKTIEIKIKNQRNDYNIYYSVNMKGHFEKNWTTIYSTWNRMKQSASQFTIFNLDLSVAPNGGQIDFQVEAAAGYWTQGDIIVPGVPRADVFFGEKSGWSSTQTITIPNGSVSATPTPDETFASPTASASSLPTTTPTQSDANSVFPQLNWLEFAAFAVLGVVVALLVVFIALLRRRISVLEQKQNGV